MASAEKRKAGTYVDGDAAQKKAKVSLPLTCSNRAVMHQMLPDMHVCML